MMIVRASRKRTYFFLAGYLLLVTALCPAASANEWERQAHQKLQQWLLPAMVPAVWECNRQRSDLHTALIRFYQYRRYQPAWVDHRGLLPEGEVVLATLRQAAAQGLDIPDDSDRKLQELLNAMLGRPVADPAVRFENQLKLDLMLTGMILRYSFYANHGRINPSIEIFSEKAEPAAYRDLATELAAIRDSGDVTSFLKQLGPHHAAYLALQERLQAYRKVQSSGGWPRIAEGPPLKFGDRGLRVARMRYRLTLSGDADFGDAVFDDHFDDAQVVAVMRFQRRHGLAPDGVVGAETLAAMNVPVQQRIRQIQLNLERWRWMPSELEPYHIMVNIPGFELKVVQAGQTVKSLRAIVGREDRPTPVLSSMMTYLELNPYWQVPSKIAREDLLPKIRKDPQFLNRQNFQVFDSWKDNALPLDPGSIDWSSVREDFFPFRLRQEPAVNNALGRVKFMFPNEYSVYIHDTPSKALFSRYSRSYSSGCVRVEKPLELAAVLLGRQNWSPEQLKEALASGQRQVVVLMQPVPVHLVYLTAWVEENGDLQFREDIYGLDRQLEALLAESAAAEQKCAATTQATCFVRSDGGGYPSDGI